MLMFRLIQELKRVQYYAWRNCSFGAKIGKTILNSNSIIEHDVVIVIITIAPGAVMVVLKLRIIVLWEWSCYKRKYKSSKKLYCR